jgi:hypothetical protein
MQESVSSRIVVSKKGMVCVFPTDVCTRNLLQKAERGKITGSESNTRFPRASCFEKPTSSVPGIWGRAYNILPQSTKGTRKGVEKLGFHAAKKGAKKLVNSDFVKILEYESSD